jgi:hypothetical protein
MAIGEAFSCVWALLEAFTRLLMSKGVFGTLAAVEQVVGACGWQINTSFVERSQPEPAAACGGDWAPYGYAVPGGGRPAAAARAVPWLRQLLPPACERTPARAAAWAHQRDELGQDVAAAHAGDGGWIDGPGLVPAGGAVVSGAPVAPAPGAVRSGRRGGASGSAGEGCLRAGPTACTRPGEPDGRGHDCPGDVTRTPPDRWSRILRRVQGQDPVPQGGSNRAHKARLNSGGVLSTRRGTRPTNERVNFSG